MKTLLALLLLGSVACADDHIIKPTCWEENVGGVPQRHCEVHRDTRVAPAPAPTQRPLYDTDAPVPPPAAYGPPPAAYGPPPAPYPGYQTTLPPRYWPGMPQQGRNWANPCTPYVCGYGSPYGYGYPPPYYYGPGIAFGFGPFRIWIP
jgi:hypothetical protein